MTSIDAFYEAVAEQIRGEIQRAPETDASVKHWIVTQTGSKIEHSPERGGEEAGVGVGLAARLDAGASGAAYVTHVPRPREHLLAEALVSEPRNSDIRRADIARTADGAELGPWQHIV